MADASAVSAATISLGQGITSYQFFMPKLQDVRRADPSDPDVRADVFLGQLAAGATTVTIGGMLTMLTGSQIPLWASIIIALVIGSLYHYALGSAYAKE